ncbi:MAG TPA: branched-chain amino acid ABC transporter permease [Clostridia bacterium]|nr:branched-chain amino acid ABC transporter permease [Clostridia bacterium]
MSVFSFLVQQIINGLSLGAMYSLIAVGFTLFFGVIDLINFAHGEIFMLGAFIALTTIGAITGSGILTGSIFLVIVIVFLVTMSVSGLVGAAIERTVIKPLRGASNFMTLLITMGVSIIIRESVMLFYPNGANPKAFPNLLPAGSISIGGAIIKYQQIFLLVVAAVTVILFYIFINKTEYGRFMRATSQDKEAALMMGIDIDKVIFITFVVGSALGALGGVLNGMYYNIIKFNMGFLSGIKGFSAAVVGGLGNIYGAVVGGLLLGFLEMSAAAFIPGGSKYQDVISFLIVILFLIFKPSGIFGEKAYEKV